MEYKEKLEEAKRLYETANADQRYVLESLFPELRESDDERIRREIINYFKCQSREEPSRKDTHNKWIVWLEKVITPNHNDIDSSFIEDIKNVINEAPLLMQSDKEKMIDWLEKQGEQKPTQEIEPFEAEHGKYYYCIKDYFCGGRKQASKGDVVQALRGLPIMGLKDAGEYFLPVNSIKCNSAWSEEDEKIRDEICIYIGAKEDISLDVHNRWLSWLEKQGEVESDNDDIEVEEKGIRESFNKIEDEKQCKQKPQRMISAEAKEAMYNKPADTVEPKYEESKTKIFDAPTPFEDKLYAFVLACEILVDPSKREFILEHSQEILDAAKEQIGKEQKSAWNEKDESHLIHCVRLINNAEGCSISEQENAIEWLKSLKDRYTWKPSDEQIEILDMVLTNESMDDSIARILRELREQLKKLKGE